MIVIEWLNKATIFMNCLFLFWFRSSYLRNINKKFDFLSFMFPESKEHHGNYVADQDANKTDAFHDHEVMNFLIIIIFIEHAIVIFKF